MANYQVVDDGPASDIFPITPDDGADLVRVLRGIRLSGDGTAGALRVTTRLGNVRDTYISVGEILPLQVTRVHATGTDAVGLEGLI